MKRNIHSLKLALGGLVAKVGEVKGWQPKMNPIADIGIENAPDPLNHAGLLALQVMNPLNWIKYPSAAVVNAPLRLFQTAVLTVARVAGIESPSKEVHN